jgi:hypothetical protein
LGLRSNNMATSLAANLVGTASTRVSEAHSVTRTGLKQQLTSTLQINLFRLSIQSSRPEDNLTSELLQILKQIIGTDDLGTWERELFSEYGTHVVESLTVGGSYSYSASVDHSTGSETKAKSVEVSLGAVLNGGLLGNVTFSHMDSTVKAAGFTSVEGSLDCMGGLATLCTSDAEHWQRSVYSAPVAIQDSFRLLPLYNVVPSAMRDQVEKMINRYTAAQLAQCPVGGYELSTSHLIQKDPSCDHYCSIDQTCVWGHLTSCLDHDKTDLASQSALPLHAGYHCCCQTRDVVTAERTGDQATAAGCGPVAATTPSGVGTACSDNGLCNPIAKRCLCDANHGGQDCLLQLVPMGDSFGGKPPERGVAKLWGGGVKYEDPVRVAACSANGDSEYNQRWWSTNNGPGEKRLQGLFGRCMGSHVELPPGVCVVTFRLTGFSWGRYDDPNGWDGNCDGDDGCQILQSACGGVSGTILKTTTNYCAYHIYTEPRWTCKVN